MAVNAIRRGRAARLADTLCERRPIGPLEVIVAVTLLLVLAFSVLGSHIVNGGFIMDDWSNAAKSRFLASCCGPGVTGTDPSFLGQVANLRNDGPASYQLGLTVIAPLAHYFLGFSMGLHLALAAALGALMSAAFYVVVRLVGLERLPAAAISALVLLFPFSDATRLWPMASFNQIAAILWLAGVLAALAGLRQADARKAALLHGCALLLYALATLTYEQVGGAVIVSVGFYLAGRAGWRSAWIRWLADVGVAGIALYVAATGAAPRSLLSWPDHIGHAGVILDDGFTLLASVFSPFATPSRLLVAGAVAIVLGLCVLRLRRLPRGDVQRAALTRWLALLATAAGGIVAGYVLTVPLLYGSPLDVGIENRTNMLPAFGWVTLLYAVAMLAGLFGFERVRMSTRWAPLVPVVVCVLVGAGYVARILDDAAAYDRSYAEQVKVLSAVGAGRPYRPGSTIYTFGHPTFIEPGIPVYAWIWDQNPAVKVWLRDPSLASFPVLPGTTFACDPQSLHPDNPFGLDVAQAASYGNAYFVDTERGIVERIDDPAACQRAAARFKPGPLARGREDCELIGEGPATRLRWQCDRRPLDGI